MWEDMTSCPKKPHYLKFLSKILSKGVQSICPPHLFSRHGNKRRPVTLSPTRAVDPHMGGLSVTNHFTISHLDFSSPCHLNIIHHRTSSNMVHMQHFHYLTPSINQSVSNLVVLDDMCSTTWNSIRSHKFREVFSHQHFAYYSGAAQYGTYFWMYSCEVV